MAYDPAGRLHEVANAAATTRFLYDGGQVVAEYNASNVLQRRYVPGPGVDDVVTWYEGSGTADRRWLVQDERGSTIAITDGAGAATSIYAYDEFGVPNSWSGARLRYAGTMMLPEAGVYHNRARAYLPALGRFAQTDPIGMAGGMNLYAYVGNDPVNFTDPSGLCTGSLFTSNCPDNIPGTGLQGVVERGPGSVEFNEDDNSISIRLGPRLERWQQFNLILGDPTDVIRSFANIYAPMSDATGTEYQLFIGYMQGRPNVLYRSPVTRGPRSGGSANSVVERDRLPIGFVVQAHAHTHPRQGTLTTRGVADDYYGFSGGDVRTAWRQFDSGVTFYVVYSDRILSMTHAQAGEYVGYRFPGVPVQ